MAQELILTTHYYLIFDQPNIFRVLKDSDQGINSINDAYAIFKVPEELQTDFNASDYNIELSENKELSISKKELPFNEFKKTIIANAYSYGNSDAVNQNLVNNIPIVIDTTLRLKIRERIFRAKEKGLNTDTIRFGNQKISLTIDKLEEMLGAVVDRAIANYEILQQHLTNMSELNNKEALSNYDYKTGYIAPLTFNLTNQ